MIKNAKASSRENLLKNGSPPNPLMSLQLNAFKKLNTSKSKQIRALKHRKLNKLLKSQIISQAQIPSESSHASKTKKTVGSPFLHRRPQSKKSHSDILQSESALRRKGSEE